MKPILTAISIAFMALTAQAQSTTSAQAAQPSTRALQAQALATLPFADRQDFVDARRGFIAALPDALVSGTQFPVWSMKPYAFLQPDTAGTDDAAKAPDTVNPSLWRQAQLNAIHGLFKVTDRVYQVRGMDISNMTIIEGDTGLIVIDPLLSVETAKAALALYRANSPSAPEKPVVAVVYSHSHLDHFGGVRGIVNAQDVATGKVTVIAPDGFMAHAVAENVLAGPAMGRRAQYMYGPLLPAGPLGQVDAGLGKNVSRGSYSLIAPTEVVRQNGARQVIDGVEVVFHLTPGSEAPAEMNMFFPQFKLLNMAENTTHNMHNLYTIRGAEVRDGNAWSRYISEAMEQFGSQTDVLIAQHHWPTWGTTRIGSFMAHQRDMYKFIHDQSVRLMNNGYKSEEIAEALKLPASLENDWASRGYYGTLSHNAKAVYQKYMGWYDANPANLNPLPPVATAKKNIEYMGGSAAVIARAKDDFAQGNFRWVASVMNQVVFAEPGNVEARSLAANALEQLGYQSEAATWRNAYLFGALELRSGVAKLPRAATPSDLVRAVPMPLVFESMGTRLNAPKAEGQIIVINWKLTDTGEQYVTRLENSALTYISGKQDPQADASLAFTRATWDAVSVKELTLPKALQTGQIKISGSLPKLQALFGLLEDFPAQFEVVEPRKLP